MPVNHPAIALGLLACALAIGAAVSTSPAAPAPPRPAPTVLREAKARGALAVHLTVTPHEADAASAVVTLEARSATGPAVLTLRADPGLVFDGVTRWELAPLRAGQTRSFQVNLRRLAPGPFGERVFAVVSEGRPNNRVGDATLAWVFGPPDPARVLPRSGATLGPTGTGALGPRERVIVTPRGERLHDTTVQ